MGSKWADISGDPLESGPGAGTDTVHDGATRERDSEKWRMPSASDDLTNFAKMVKGPEDLHMLPQDMDLLPQEINAELNDWTNSPLTLFYWNPVDDPVDG